VRCEGDQKVGESGKGGGYNIPNLLRKKTSRAEHIIFLGDAKESGLSKQGSSAVTGTEITE